MKELSIEEKSYYGNYKAHTELINRLEDVKDAIKKQNYGIAMDILCKPYPQFQVITHSELKESEDERIRKALLRFHKSTIDIDGIKGEDILAWLEKQGEHKPADKVEPKFKVGDIISNGTSEVKIIEVNDNSYSVTNDEIENDCNLSNWVVYFKDQDNWKLVEQKPAWSEEDERIYKVIVELLNSWSNGTIGSCVIPPNTDRYINWFKSLKNRVQPKREWSEDERIRQFLIQQVTETSDEIMSYRNMNKENVLAWLEKQGEQKPVEPQQDMLSQEKYSKAVDECVYGEQKPTDKVESKFKVGDWVICCDYEPIQIIDIKHRMYCWSNGDIRPIEMVDNNSNIHLWTIQDAKDGDVLVDEDNNIGIYKEIEGICWHSYIYLGCDNRLYGFSIGGSHIQSNTKPATKEQCDTLMKAMADAGYTFDFEKKELKKIEQIPAELGENRSKELSLSLQIQAYLNTASDELYAKGKPLYSEERIKDIHKCMLMWQKLHNAYFYQKPAWSEEDERVVESILKYYRYMREEWVNWLKSLKDRIQPQNRLKESLATADLENSLCDIQDGFSDTSYEYRILGEAIEFIRCTEPKPQWKPSDEQIKVCKEVYADILSAKGFDLGTVNSELNRLEEELKKLREE